MKIAIIGSGRVGTALARASQRAGHDIVFGVRDVRNSKHAALTASGFGVASVADSVAAQDVVILATPWAATLDLVRTLELNGKTIIDTTNPIAFGPSGLQLLPLDAPSGAEAVAAACTEAFVFKTLNQVGAEIMQSAGSTSQQPLMFVAGDDAARKVVVLSLVRDLGFDVRDAGGISAARHLESLAVLWIGQAVAGPLGRHYAFAAVPWTASS